MSNHIARQLRLSRNNKTLHIKNGIQCLSDHDIIHLAERHGLPLAIAIDGSYSNQRATTNISIISPDIHEEDTGNEWQDRLGIILLSRSIILPERWGYNESTINMAESLGILMSEYSLPSATPAMYITDSQNARSLHYNLNKGQDLTNCSLIRKVLQGIHQPIANQLSYALSQRYKEEDLCYEMHNRLIKGQQTCQEWCSKTTQLDTTTLPLDGDHAIESDEWNEDEEDDNTDEEPTQTHATEHKTRYKFTKDMLDLIGIHIILKVFSHQLTQNFMVNSHGKHPAPNPFITSGNQYADNAAEQCHKLKPTLPTEAQNQPKLAHEICMAPFSPRCVFTHEGYTASKSASAILKEKANRELILRLQHRRSHGLLQHLLPFIGLEFNELGEETMGRDIIRNTAPCHTRKIYTNSDLASNIYRRYYLHLSEEEKENNLTHLDSQWQSNQATVAVIKKCPFCDKACPGNLTHLHLYCRNDLLINARHFCYDQIENAMEKIYKLAATEEQRTNKGNCQINSPYYRTNLQEAIETTARTTECHVRPICIGNKTSNIVHEARHTNKAILLLREIQLGMAQQQLQPEKLDEYNKWPLSHRAGLIHSIAEEKFDLGSATIFDVVYLGLVPKAILQPIYKFQSKLPHNGAQENSIMEMQAHVNMLITSLVWRPLIVQKVVNYLLAHEKNQLSLHAPKQTTQDNAINTPNNYSTKGSTQTHQSENTKSRPTHKRCTGLKCKILCHLGILRRPLENTTKGKVCSVCTREDAKRRKTIFMEDEFLATVISEEQAQLLIPHMDQPTSLPHFRKLIGYLSSINSKSSLACTNGAS